MNTDNQIELLQMEYQMRAMTGNSAKDVETLNDILRKIEAIVLDRKAELAHREDPSISLEDHKDIIIMQKKLGV